MSKYIIELGEDAKVIQSISITPLGTVYVDSWYVENLEELNSDYINENFGELQDQAYHKGLEEGNDIGYKDGVKDGQNEAWEAARKLFSSMADSDIEKVFPTEWNNGGFHALINLQPQEAIAKLKAYEEKQNDKFEFGDEIIGSDGVKGCVISKDNEGLDTMYALFDGGRVPQYVTQSNYRKTGKRYDIEKLLEAMKA